MTRTQRLDNDDGSEDYLLEAQFFYFFFPPPSLFFFYILISFKLCLISEGLIQKYQG